MSRTIKPICLFLALAMLSGSLAFCQEPPLPAPVDTAAVPAQPAPPLAPAATADTLKAPAQAAMPDSAAAPDSSVTAKKQSKVFGTWKPGKIKLDRNGRIFLGVSAALLGGVYLVHRVFRKGVK